MVITLIMLGTGTEAGNIVEEMGDGTIEVETHLDIINSVTMTGMSKERETQAKILDP